MAQNTDANSKYRPIKQLSHVLRETSCNYFDDGLYVEAVDFLSNVLHAGTYHHLPAQIPFPQQLACLATLVVHPSVTTRTNAVESHQASNDALELLYDVNNLIGPLNGEFSSAFQFLLSKSARGIKRRWGSDSGDEDENKGLKCTLANSGSLFSQTEDFWQVVGWAFNCSIAYKKRWDRWRLLLEFMLDVMERDWCERVIQSQKYKAQGDEEIAEKLCLESIIGQYLLPADNRNARRRITRALFVDASQKVLNEFGEVFPNELREPRKQELKKEWKIDMEEADYGDYEDDDDDGTVQSNGKSGSLRPLRRGASNRLSSREVSEDEEEDPLASINETKQSLKGAELLGGMDSVILRERLMSLLYSVCLAGPRYFTRPDDLFDTWTEFLRPMPLDRFTVLLDNSQLPPKDQCFFHMNLLLIFLNPAPPVYDPLNSALPSQLALERHFLPHAANSNSRADNAKVSLILEKLMMELSNRGALTATNNLVSTVLEGIKLRQERAIGDARKAGKGMVGEEKQAKEVLEMSGKRLMAILDAVERGAGMSKKRLPTLEHESSGLSSLSSPLASPAGFSPDMEDGDDMLTEL